MFRKLGPDSYINLAHVARAVFVRDPDGLLVAKVASLDSAAVATAAGQPYTFTVTGAEAEALRALLEAEPPVAAVRGRPAA
jgi:hypothetical protein